MARKNDKVGEAGMEIEKIIYKMAEEGIVLLKNDNEALPLNCDERVAVIGDFAANPQFKGGSSFLANAKNTDNTKNTYNTLNCLTTEDFCFVGYEKGFLRKGRNSNRQIRKAIKLAFKADTILLYLGLDEVIETEKTDLKNLRLPQNQINLLAALSSLGKKVVVVVSCLAPIETEWTKYASAVIHGYLGGKSGARAMINALTGKVNA